jgi:O-methyltransferase
MRHGALIMRSSTSHVSPGSFHSWLRQRYVAWIRPLLRTQLSQQRVKLLVDVWGYAQLLRIPALSRTERLRLLARCLRVDWGVPHAHKPRELAIVCYAIGERRAQPGEVVVEAGCWNGGSSAKLSAVCALLGYRLHIFDSFQGVEPLTAEERALSGWDFSRTYASPESTVRQTLRRYGNEEVCELHPGWFVDTLAAHPLADPVRVAYIDCDLAKGTREVLTGIAAALTPDAWVFSQDYQFAAVRQLLADEATWAALGRGVPRLRHYYRNLAIVRPREGEHGAATSALPRA